MASVGTVNYHVHKPERQAFEIDAGGHVGRLISPELVATQIAVQDLRQGETTADFAAAVETAVGGRKGERIHPATRTFQAIRMFVNDELGEIARGLASAERLLNEGGRLVVVTFHSLEDRLVKRFLRERGGKLGSGSRHAPERAGGKAATFELISTKAQEPTEAETADNPRARSAKLRAAIRTSAPAWDAAVDTGVALPDFDYAEASA